MKLFDILETTFENFDETVRRYLNKALGAAGIQYNDSQIFAIIFKGLKGIMQNAMFYIEDAFTEQNIYTAVRKKSLYSLAKLSGYEPYYGAAATGNLLCQLKLTSSSLINSNRISIYNKSTIVNERTGIKYVLLLPTDYYIIDITKPIIKHEFKIIQGFYQKTTYIASGLLLESFNITIAGLFDRNYIEVYVDGELWSEAACLYDMYNNSHEYLLNVAFDGTFTVTFGNGIYGAALNNGQTVEIVYLVHNGTTGNVVPSAQTRFSFVTNGITGSGQSVNVNDYTTLEMSNCISGGQDADSIAEVRQMIGASSRSLVLATPENFQLFFRRFSFIGYSNIWYDNNASKFYICCLSNNIKELTVEEYLSNNEIDYLLNEDQKQMILNTINNSNKMFGGLSIDFINPKIRKYSIICYLKIDSEYERETIKDQISNLIVKYFIDIITGVDYIYKTDIINLIVNNVGHIKYFDIEFLSELAEQTFKNGYYEKYKLVHRNFVYDYEPYKVFYEPNVSPGLDDLGNIKIDSNIEIPLLKGGFRYYYDKENDKDRKNFIMTETIQFVFV